LGTIDKRKETVDLLKQTIEKVIEAGFYGSPGFTLDEFKESIERFERCHLDRTMVAVEKIEQLTNLGELLNELSRVPQETILKTEEFLRKAISFLGVARARVDSQISNFGAANDDIESTETLIRSAFAEIDDLLNGFGGLHDNNASN
jgi:hypothetical protein